MTEDNAKSKAQLISELEELRRKTENLEDTSFQERSGEFYRALAGNSPVGVHIFRAEGFIYTNQLYREYTGYSEQELLSMRPIQILHPDDVEAVKEDARRMLVGEKVAPREFRYINKAGATRWAQETVMPVSYDGERAALGLFLDITPRKKAEETLRLSDAALRSIHEGVIALNNERKVIYWNAECEQILGIPAAEALGKSMPDLIEVIEDYPGQNRERLDLLLSRGYNREEMLYRTPKGEIWFDVHAQVIIEGTERNGWITLLADISERKKMEAALRESEEKFSKVFFVNPNPMLIHSEQDAVINDVNQAFLDHSGFSREECIGTHIDELGLWADPGERDEIIRQISENGRVRNYEALMKTKSGDVWNVLISSERVSMSGEYFLITTTQDITELKQAEQRERQLQHKLAISSRLASVGEMAAGIAHEINNPLTGVVGFSSLLMQRDLPEDISKDITMIHEGASRVASITNRMLAFSRQHKPEKSVVDINEIIKTTIDMRRYELETNNIRLHTEFESDLPHTVADAGQLQQVFLNIILNAETEMIQAHGMGTLTLKTEKVGDMLRTIIADSGPGITDEVSDRIYDPFFTTRDVGKGAGLGLSVSYGIIQEHNGRIDFRSEPGQGAEFVVDIPIITRESQLAFDVPETETPVISRASTVLIIDDEEVVRQFVIEVLKQDGHRIEISVDGETALDRLKNETFDVILLDIKLPGMNGIELYRKLRKIRPDLLAKIIFVTGDVLGTETTEFLSKTGASYLTKPFSVYMLRRALAEVLHRS